MFRPTLMIAAVSAFFMIGAAPAFAAERYKLDQPHTQIIFAVDHMGLSKSYGKFLSYEGTIEIDRADPAKSNVDVTIQSNSLDMGDKVWTEHVSGEKFFNVTAHPTITFKSTAVTLTGENTADVTGDLTLLGVTKPVTLKVTHNKSGERPTSGTKAIGFSATTNFKRTDFGMDYGVGMLGDDVAITIEVEADIIADAAAEPAAATTKP